MELTKKKLEELSSELSASIQNIGEKYGLNLAANVKKHDNGFDITVSKRENSGIVHNIDFNMIQPDLHEYAVALNVIHNQGLTDFEVGDEVYIDNKKDKTYRVVGFNRRASKYKYFCTSNGEIVRAREQDLTPV